MKLVIESIVEGISTRQDGSVAIKLATQEMDSTNAASLFSFRNKYVKVLISDSNISAIEEEMVDATKLAAVKKGKTPSQRLRAVLFVQSQQLNVDNFEAYYLEKMNEIIEGIKSKLE